MCFWSWRFPYFGYGGFWNMSFMLLSNLIFWISIILIIVYFSKNFSKIHKKADKEELLKIVKRKLASGEITQEDYDRIKRILD